MPIVIHTTNVCTNVTKIINEQLLKLPRVMMRCVKSIYKISPVEKLHVHILYACLHRNTTDITKIVSKV